MKAVLITFVILISIALFLNYRIKLQRKRFKKGLGPDKFLRFIMRIVQKIKNNPAKIYRLLLNAGVQKGMKVLDYGCGIGNFSIEASKIVGPSGNIIAADIDEKAMKTLQQQINKKKITNIDTRLINSLDDINEDACDCILLLDVIHMIKDKRKLIHDLLNKLKDNGQLLIKFKFGDPRMHATLLNSCNFGQSKQLNNKCWILNK